MPNAFTWDALRKKGRAADEYLTNLSIGGGEALTGQLEGLQQIAAHPIETGKAIYGAGKEFAKDPRGTISNAMRERIDMLRSGPIGVGRTITEFMPTPGRAGKLGKLEAVGESTIKGAKRNAFPGIYGDPRAVAREAEERVAPPSAAMPELFGVTREDLAALADRPGDAPGFIPGAAARPKGTEHGALVMQPENTRRLATGLEAAREHAPGLFTGMKGWYVTDPMYQRLVELVGPQEAAKRMERLNAFTAMASPSSDVVTELLRGSAANRLAQAGRFDEFVTHGGKPLKQRIEEGLPEDLTNFPSHAYHSTAQAPAMEQYYLTGVPNLKSPKVPLYMQASLPHGMGRQSDIPVGDAHWSRGVGLADVRGMRTVKGKPKIPGASVSTAELQELSPWWRNEIAAPNELEAVPGQAIAWGLYSPHTGVDTAIGAPKLELISDLITQAAQHRGIKPATLRDQFLLGTTDLNTDSRLARMLEQAAALRGGD